MSDTPTDTQAARRSERLTVALTRHERKAVDFVARARGLRSTSTLLRELSIGEIMAAYADLRRMVADDAPAGDTAA